MIPVALTIAGSDPSGGAGLQADLKTFHQQGVYGASVVTLLTVQSTQGVEQVEVLDAEFVAAQLRCVLNDLRPAVIKTGAMGNRRVIERVASMLTRLTTPLVVDPVMISKHGHALCDDDAIECFKEVLLPHVFVLTPNRWEAERLMGRSLKTPADFESAVCDLAKLGPQHVLLKCGELAGKSVDVLWSDNTLHWLEGPRHPSQGNHGSGCVLSAAVTAHLAWGRPVLESIERARRFVSQAIATSQAVGQGIQPTNMHTSS